MVVQANSFARAGQRAVQQPAGLEADRAIEKLAVKLTAGAHPA
jgi:hypothetical protein